MRRVLLTILAIGLLAGITTSAVFALNYDGEDFCQDSPAWPNGTYLGQMHPYHSDFYRGYAERRGWDPCTTWATDQRNSAIRGLRELGYTVTAPGELPIAGNEISLDGRGTATRNITLTDGLWTVAYNVSGNLGDFGSGTNFHRQGGGCCRWQQADRQRDRRRGKWYHDHAGRFWHSGPQRWESDR